jgi:hypothetical protein
MFALNQPCPLPLPSFLSSVCQLYSRCFLANFALKTDTGQSLFLGSAATQQLPFGVPCAADGLELNCCSSAIFLLFLPLLSD